MTKRPDEPKPPSRDYTVGYGRPPVEHQFRPGQSGNPKGRPQGMPTLEALFEREARRLVKLKTPDGVKHITKLEALIRTVFQQALGGDLGAARIILQQAVPTGGFDDDQDAELLADDEVVGRMLVRFQHLIPQKDAKR